MNINRWPADSPWKLEREVDLIPIPGSVMIPDFRLVHTDGREYLLEIVGWMIEAAAACGWEMGALGALPSGKAVAHGLIQNG